MKEPREAATVPIKNENNLPGRETIDRLMELGGNFKIINPHNDGIPFILVPIGMRMESLQKFIPPQRIEQLVILLEPDSFCDYIKEFKSPNTRIFIGIDDELKGATMEAIMDYHGKFPGLEPHYCQHRVSYTTRQTPEWKTWCEHDRKKMSQLDFANFLEDNQKLFVNPTGASLLELVQNLEGKQDVRFNSAIRLNSGGSRLNFDEDVELRGASGSSTKSGDIVVPSEIVAGIAPIYGAVDYEVKARLKYRIESKKLTLWYETIQRHVIMRDSILAIVKTVGDKTELIPFLGSAPENKDVTF